MPFTKHIDPHDRQNDDSFLAIWGAILGTMTFIWSIWKWRHESPRVVAKIEILRSFEEENNFRGLRLKLRNRGGQKTTLESIYLYRRWGWFEGGVYGFLSRVDGDLPWRQDVGESNPETAKMPTTLEINGKWEGFIPLEAWEDADEAHQRQVAINRDIPELLRSGQLRYSIVCAHTARKIRGIVKDEEWRLKE